MVRIRQGLGREVYVKIAQVKHYDCDFITKVDWFKYKPVQSFSQAILVILCVDTKDFLIYW